MQLTNRFIHVRDDFETLARDEHDDNANEDNRHIPFLGLLTLFRIIWRILNSVGHYPPILKRFPNPEIMKKMAIYYKWVHTENMDDFHDLLENDTNVEDQNRDVGDQFDNDEFHPNDIDVNVDGIHSQISRREFGDLREVRF